MKSESRRTILELIGRLSVIALRLRILSASLPRSLAAMDLSFAKGVMAGFASQQIHVQCLKQDGDQRMRLWRPVTTVKA